MSTKWPKVKLREVIRRSAEIIEILADLEYREVTVRLWGNGVVERRRVLGNEIAGSRRFVVRVGQFIVSRIDARNGAMGIIPRELEGAVVTNDFPLFNLKETHLLPEFIGWLCRTRDFVELCQKASEGTTNRVRLKEDRFLNLEIPLPSMAEQQRIVAKINQLAAKIAEARTLHQKADEEADALIDTITACIFCDEKMKTFRVNIAKADLILNKECRNPQQFDPEGLFTYLDISSVGKGPTIISVGRIMPNRDAPSRARRVMHKDDVIISTVRPTLRSFAKVGEGLDNQICSTGFAVLTCGQSINPDFLLCQVCSPFFVEQCIARTTGGHYPAINDSNLREVEIVVPPLPEQHRIVAELDAVQVEVDSLKRLQAETTAELDALLPSILDKAFKGEL